VVGEAACAQTAAGPTANIVVRARNAAGSVVTPRT
jgi:hypothetical protein